MARPKRFIAGWNTTKRSPVWHSINPRSGTPWSGSPLNIHRKHTILWQYNLDDASMKIITTTQKIGWWESLSKLFRDSVMDDHDGRKRKPERTIWLCLFFYITYWLITFVGHLSMVRSNACPMVDACAINRSYVTVNVPDKDGFRSLASSSTRWSTVNLVVLSARDAVTCSRRFEQITPTSVD